MKKIIITTAVIFFSIAGIADAAPDSNSIIRNGIEYYIQTDKAVYTLGENVQMLYGVTNLTDVSVNLGTLLPDPPDNYDLRIMQGNAQVWWYPYTAITAVIRDFILQPLETKEFQTTWDMMNDNGTPFQEYDDFLVSPGSYNIVGEVALSFGYERVPVSVQIDVIPEPAKTYYVNATEGSDDNDGLSPQTPFATIQKAIDSALDGDTVLVADGTYTGPGNRDIDFLGKAITLKSENGPENCIIDCNGTEAEHHRGFYFHNGEDGNSVLEGFTIINGYASGNWPLNGGGGIYCGSSSPTIFNCILERNSATYGGGIFIFSFADPIISNCIFTNNVANNRGGGIYNSDSSDTVITNSIFTGNWAKADHGGGFFNGNQGSPILVHCTFTGNRAEGGYGGGVYNFNPHQSFITLANCIFWLNIGSGRMDERAQVYGGPIVINYCCIQGLASIGGTGNIDADPCFVEPGYWADANDPNIIVEPNDPNAVWIDGDYYLLPDSLCIDAGDPNYIPEPNETDLDGNPRVIGGRIDMGAYETNYIQAAMKFTPQTINCNSKGNFVKAHITLPEGFSPEDVDVNEPAIAEPMGAYSEYIKVLGNDDGPVKLEICFDREAFCDLLTDTDDDSLEVMVIGSLTAGRYFYATDTIKIKPRHQRITYRYKKNQRNQRPLR